MLRTILTVVLIGGVGALSVEAQDRPSRTVTLDVAGAYGLGVGAGYELRTGPHLALRGSVGWLGRFDVFGGDLALGPISGVGWVVGRAGGRRVEGEAALGLQLVPSALGSPNSAYRVAAPVGYVGVRLNAPTESPEPLDPDPPDLVLRLGVVIQSPSIGSSEYDDVFVFPSISVGAAF